MNAKRLVEYPFGDYYIISHIGDALGASHFHQYNSHDHQHLVQFINKLLRIFLNLEPLNFRGFILVKSITIDLILP